MPVDRIRGWLADEGIDAPCKSTRGPGDATRMACAAVEEGAELIVAYGGDGTINEIISGLIGKHVTLGILPGGTANVLARELSIPVNLRRAVKVLTSGMPTQISLGRAGSRHFHLMAGIGLDAAVVTSMPQRLKRVLGISSFWIQGIRQLYRYPLKPFQLEVDGRQFEGTFAVVANARNYGGKLVIAPGADVRSEWLDVCLFHTHRKSRFLFYLAAVYLRRLLALPDVTYLKTRRVSARGDPAISVQVDGEIAGCLPMDFEIVPRGLTVMVPAA